MRRKMAVAGAAVAAALLAWMLLFASTSVAYADEAADHENEVNTQQLPDSSFIYDTSIVDLSTADSYYDNQTVQVTGEAIGDCINANASGRRKWITLSTEGDSSTVSVLMSADSAAKIDSYGAYGVRGTTLQVRGTYHLACSEHEGLSDLHADVVDVVSPGARVEDELDLRMFVPGAVAVVLGLGLMAVFYWMRERQR